MPIKNYKELQASIALHEVDVQVKRTVLVEQYEATLESLKPVNIMKGAFNKIADTPDLVEKIVGTAAGLGAGVLSKKLLIGKSNNIFKKIFGVAIELAIAGVVSKNATAIKEKGIKLYHKFRGDNGTESSEN
jgi:hypothetical protein